MIKLGERIKELRLRDGRTQEALAGKLGVTAQAISRFSVSRLMFLESCSILRSFSAIFSE